jgi:hypothetical protein
MGYYDNRVEMSGSRRGPSRAGPGRGGFSPGTWRDYGGFVADFVGLFFHENKAENTSGSVEPIDTFPKRVEKTKTFNTSLWLGK